MMSMAGLLVLTKHVHHSKSILRKYVISRRQIASESPGLSVPSVTGVWIPQRSVSSQRHESSFRVKTSIPNGKRQLLLSPGATEIPA